MSFLDRILGRESDADKAARLYEEGFERGVTRAENAAGFLPADQQHFHRQEDQDRGLGCRNPTCDALPGENLNDYDAAGNKIESVRYPRGAESPERVIETSDTSTDNGSMESNERNPRMTSISFALVGDGDERNIILVADGQIQPPIHSSHPNFEAILKGAIESDADVLDLIDLGEAAVKNFQRIGGSERVTLANGRLYFDGDQISTPETEQILRFMDSGTEDFMPLVRFFENVQANPSNHSREQLFNWLNRQNERGEGFTITPEGMIVGYKGVRKTSEGLTSISQGRAIVNGEVHNGAIPNPLGATVEMPRSEVAHDPAVGCHRGLHVGTYAYANGFAQGALLEVHVNPRDVVSVPTECDAAKMRTCRYTVVKMIDAPYTSPIVYSDYDSDYDAWGDSEYDDENDEW